nr:uncharacterized protein LOC124813509 [Hydra vulgaris]
MTKSNLCESVTLHLAPVEREIGKSFTSDIFQETIKEMPCKDTLGSELLKKRLSFMYETNAKLKSKHKEKLAVIKLRVRADPYVIKRLNQTIKRKNLTIRYLKQKLAKISSKNLILCENEFKKKIKIIKLKKKEQQNDLSSTILSKDNQIKTLEVEKLDKLKDSVIDHLPFKKDRKSYTWQLRLMIYDAIINQVPTKNIPILLQKFFNHFGLVNAESFPQRSTVEEIVRELGIISNLHAAEVAISTPNLTLGFDATTQEGIHINSVHFTTKTECHVIAIDQLSGGTAHNYQTHIVSSIDELAFLYSDFHNCDYQESRTNIIKNISNSMADRVAANHAAIQLINSSWGKVLNELNCHVHPLETIATACRSALKSIEKNKGVLFSKDCIAGNIVLQMNKMRYKNGKGDPKGFTIFLNEMKLPKGLIPRYRGNRLHILFHICGIFIQHYNSIIKFLSSDVVSCGGLKSSLKIDFINETAKKEMCVLGLLGKTLTGPWMALFYQSGTGSLSHIEGIKVVKKLLKNVYHVKNNPMLLFNAKDLFGNSIKNDKVFKTIVSVCTKDKEVKQMIILCLSAIIDVLERQYKRYFNLNLSLQLIKETQTARLHNIDAEEIMGMFSAAKHRAPNSTLCFLSSKLREIKNNVVIIMYYIEKKDEDDKEKIVYWAVNKARTKREMNKKKY